MITARDKKIIKFVEEYKSITINQCTKIFFKGHKEAYDQARKRLQVIHKAGLLKRYRKDVLSEAIYYMDKILKPHDLKILDFMAELSEFDIYDVAKEGKIKIDEKTTYVVDALITLSISDELKVPIILEIDYSHYTSEEKINNITNYLEKKHEVPYLFIIIKLSQEKFLPSNIGNYSSLFIVPWDTNKYGSDVIYSLRSFIECAKDKYLAI